jgi:deazaflavin-dependent oxidoreductase (nitroreductase family)
MAKSTDRQLAQLAHKSTLQVTTFGRKTGKRHTRTVWFLVEGGTVYLVTLNLQRDWPRNVMKNGRVELDIDGNRFAGTAVLIEDRRRLAHVKRLLCEKYWAAWLGSWIGFEPEGAFEVSV